MDISSIMPILTSEMSNNGQNMTDKVKNTPEKAGEAFEAMFYNMILSSMNKSITNIEKSKTGKMQEDWAWTLMIQNMATEMAKEKHLNVGELLSAESNGNQF